MTMYAATAPLYACDECGVVVHDPQLHIFREHPELMSAGPAPTRLDVPPKEK